MRDAGAQCYLRRGRDHSSRTEVANRLQLQVRPCFLMFVLQSDNELNRHEIPALVVRNMVRSK